MGPIMLALSTFRNSDRAVKLAIEKAKEGKNLIIAFVVDANLARYIIGSSLSLYPELEEKCEEDILKEHQHRAEEKVSDIVKAAEEYGIDVKIYVNIGRFAPECLKVVQKEKPELIITTRSKRHGWVKRLFGSPVDYLIANVKCPVIEA